MEHIVRVAQAGKQVVERDLHREPRGKALSRYRSGPIIISATDRSEKAGNAPAGVAQPPRTTPGPDAAMKQALQALVDRYNAVLKPKKTLALSTLLAKYPEPEKARAALAAAIRKADGGGVEAQAQAPSTAVRAAAGNGRKYGFPAHLA